MRKLLLILPLVLAITACSGYKKVVVKARSATVEQLLELTLARAAVKGHPLGWYIDGQTICVASDGHIGR